MGEQVPFGWRRRVLAGLLVLAVCGLLAGPLQGQDKTAVDNGQRVFTCAHSFHFFVPPLLADMARAAKIEGHETAGLSAIGGSRVIQHWDVSPEKNQVRPALREGRVDVLTLSPIHLPDEGIERFCRLAAANNPKVRVTVQENWLPYDAYDPKTPLMPRKVNHDAPTAAGLRELHEPYFRSLDNEVRRLNKELGREVVFAVPVGQAVIALREKILDGQAPGLKRQSDLFTDPIGHPRAAIMALAAYCHYAVIYRRSPVGLAAPATLAKLKDPTWSDELNRLLQELAWDAVTHHPLSGVPAPAKP